MKFSPLFLDFDKKYFLEILSKEINNKFSLLSNIEFSLKNAIKYYYSKILKFDLDINILSFDAEETTLKKIATEGFFIKNLKFKLLFNEKVDISDDIDDEIKFKKGKNFEFIDIKYQETWIDAYIQTFKRKNPEIRVNIYNLIISKCFFENLYKDKHLLCNKSCSEMLLQEYPRNCWDILVLFQCKICGKLYYCSCQEKSYEIIKKHCESITNTDNYKGSFMELYDSAIKKDKICHICKSEPPKFRYCHEMYGSKFKTVYGSYIVLEAIKIANKYISYEDDDYKNYIKQADQLLREKLDYPMSGKKWVNETYLYNIIKMIFCDYRVEREYSPNWLNRKRIDIFVHELNLAVEYQGVQHYQAVDIFGGKEGLINTQKRDKEKYELCKQHNVNLIYFKYNEELTEQTVINRLEKFIKTSK